MMFPNHAGAIIQADKKCTTITTIFDAGNTAGEHTVEYTEATTIRYQRMRPESVAADVNA
jgi:hypothetical protein